MPTPSQPTSESAQARGRRLLQAAVIALAGWFAFSPALHGAWLWDDAMEVARNANLRGVAGLILPQRVPYPARHAWHLYTPLIDIDRLTLSRDAFMADLKPIFGNRRCKGIWPPSKPVLW